MKPHADEKKLSSGVIPLLQTDSDPRETAEWLESLDFVCRTRAASGPNSCWKSSANGPSASACPSPPAPRRPISTPSRPTSSPPIPATARSNGASRASSAGTPWRWWCGRTRPQRHRRPYFHLRLGRHALRSRLQPFLPRQAGPEPPDQVFFQGHASPGIYARAFLLGRLDRTAAGELPPRVGAGRRAVVLSASLAHARLLGIPHGVDGPGPDHGHLSGPVQPLSGRPRHQADAKASRVWAFLGDGECDEPETLGAITLAAREKLDNLIFVINCNLQRLDGPVRGNGKIIQELEGAFRGAGWNVIKVLWGDDWDPLLAKDTDGLLVRRMGEVVDGEFQKYTVMPGATSASISSAYPRLKAMVEHLSDEQLSAAPRRARSG